MSGDPKFHVAGCSRVLRWRVGQLHTRLQRLVSVGEFRRLRGELIDPGSALALGGAAELC